MTKSAKLEEGDRDPDLCRADQASCFIWSIKRIGPVPPTTAHRLQFLKINFNLEVKSITKKINIVFKTNYQIKYLAKKSTQGVSLVGNERR
ncbi:hypothetical protein BH10BDE1_BH10BDE1_21620 [soil metagenome]